MINFPDTPTLAQLFTTAGSSWQWDGNKWEGATVAGGGPYLLLTGGTISPGPVIIRNTAGSPPQPPVGTDVPLLWGVNDGSSTVALMMDTYGSGYHQFIGRRARGTIAAPTALQTGDIITAYSAQGRAATAHGGTVAQLQIAASENWTNTAQGTRIALFTTPNGTAALTEAMRIDHNGNVGIGTTAPAARLHVASGSGYFTPAVTPTTNATARQLLIGEGSGNSAYVMALGYANVGGFVGTMQATSNGSPTGLSLNADGGNVGIGTTTPQNKLDVNGGITVRMQGTPAISIDHITGSYRFIRWLTSGSARWDVLTNATAEGSGNVGSDFNITRYDNTGTSLGVALSITRSNGACANTSGAWTTISDASVKQNVQPYTRGLDAIVALNPVEFRYAAGTPFAEADKPSRQLFGLIADDVKPHVPEIVGSTTATIGKKEGVELSTLEPGNLIYAIINAIKELNAKVVAMSPPPARRKAA